MNKPIGNERIDNLMYKESKAGVLWITADGGFKFYDYCPIGQERV